MRHLHSWKLRVLGCGILAAAVFVVALFAGVGPWISGTAVSVDSDRPPAAQVHIDPADGSRNVALDSPVTVSGNVELSAVDVTAADGKGLAGDLDPYRLEWTSSAPLKPSTAYTVHVTGTAPDGSKVTRTSAFTTMTPAQKLRAYVLPDDNEVVGIAMPVVVRFDHSVSDRATVESHLHVDTSVPLVGAWHWFGSREAHWRPQAYWPTGTKATVTVALAGVQAGDGLWGDRDVTVTFTIGAAHVSNADLNTHQMTVTSDGAVVKVLPFSGGRPKYPTTNGIHFVWGKQHDVLMDSATVGIPRNSPDGYYEHVYEDVAISTSGEYVHAAPWSVGSQGRANVSHGCINVSPTDASWFYDFSQRGDLVIVSGSSRPAGSAYGTEDWNLGWPDWVAGSAIRPDAPTAATPR